MTRPADLPDYDSPPLTEVVVGVQFDSNLSLGVIGLGEIYDLYKSEYPHVQEHPPLEPRIETFGGLRNPSRIPVSLGNIPLLPRLWFVSASEDHLVQFQYDRLILNWRKRHNGGDYPRFEGVFEKFGECLNILLNFYKSKGSDLRLTQFEVSYINIIEVEKFCQVSDFLKTVQVNDFDIDSVSMATEETVCDEHLRPHSRFFTDIQSVHLRDSGNRAIRLNFTMRGSPEVSSFDSIAERMHSARERIVRRFDAISTEAAKEKWGRKIQ